MKYDEVQLECPNPECKGELEHDCNVIDSHLRRVSGPDDYVHEFSYLKELWHCTWCDTYFEVYYKFDKIVPLVRKEKENNVGKDTNN